MPLKYKGKLLEDCSKEELIQAILDLEELYRKAEEYMAQERDSLFQWVPYSKKAASK